MKRDTTLLQLCFPALWTKQCNSDDTVRRFISSPCGKREVTSILFHPFSTSVLSLRGHQTPSSPHPDLRIPVPSFLSPNTSPALIRARTRLTFTRLTKEVRDPLTLTTNLRFRKSSKSLRPSESLAFHLSGKHTR